MTIWRRYCVVLLLFLSSVTIYGQGVPSQIDAALADLSNRVGQAITLDNGTLTNWRWSQEDFGDASLGCPRPGLQYTQAVTPGYIFELTYRGVVYDYRVTLDGSRVILCEEISTSAPTAVPDLAEQYSNPLCAAPTAETGPYPRSHVSIDTLAQGTLAVNRLREQPSVNATILTEIPQGAVFIVTAGPECDADGIVWWQIDFDGVVGWTAEAQGEDRFIVPRAPDGLPALAPITPENSMDLQPVAVLQGNLRPSFAFAPDGSTLAALTGTGSEAVALYDLNEITAQPRYLDGDVSFLSLAYHPSGTQILLGSAGGGVRVWNIGSDAPLLEALFLQTHIADVEAVAVAPDGQRFASAGTQALTTATQNTDNAALLWDFESVSQVAAFDDATARIDTLRFSPDGAQVTAVTDAGDLLVWSVAAPETPLLTGSGATTAVYSSNGQFLAVGRTSGAIDVLNATDGTAITTLTGHLGAVRSLAFSPDNRLLLSGSDDGTVRLWNTQSDENVGTLELSAEQAVTAVAFSPNGNLIVASGEDARLQLLGVALP